jgi:hypothetical protein
MNRFKDKLAAYARARWPIVLLLISLTAAVKYWRVDVYVQNVIVSFSP